MRVRACVGRPGLTRDIQPGRDQSETDSGESAAGACRDNRDASIVEQEEDEGFRAKDENSEAARRLFCIKVFDASGGDFNLPSCERSAWAACFQKHNLLSQLTNRCHSRPIQSFIQ